MAKRTSDTALADAFDEAHARVDVAEVRWRDALARLASTADELEAAREALDGIVGRIAGANLGNRRDTEALALVGAEWDDSIPSKVASPGTRFEVLLGGQVINLVVGNDHKWHELAAR